MTAIGAGYKMESPEVRALASITVDSYDYRDQGKLLTKLTSDVSYLAQYTRQMQKGIDAANTNFVEQIGQFITELGTLIAGPGDTSFDFGDLRYILQAAGALFGFDEATGLASIFPINLFSAAWHFFSTYIIPVDNMGEYINWLIDQFLATLLDWFGEIPIIGDAIQQFAVWITNIRDLVDALWTLFGSWTAPFVEWLTSTVQWIYETFFGWTEPIASWVGSSLQWLMGLFGSWTSAIVTWIYDSLSWLTDIFNAWTAPFVNWLTNAVSGLTGMFGDWSAAIAKWVHDSIAWLTELFTDWTAPFVTTITTVVNFVTTAFGDWSAAIATWIHDSVTWLTNLFATWDGPFVSLIKEAIQVIQNIVDWFVGGIGNALSNLFPWAKKLPQMQVVNGQEVIKTGNVPQIDGTKITGTLSDMVIPSLNTSKIGSGTFSGSFITDGAISTDKLSDLAVSSAKVQDLAITGAKTTGLDGSKITGGTVAPTYIGNLPTSKITSGTFSSGFIADNAIITSKLLNGAVTSAKASNLDASNVTTGSFGTGQIPNLDTNKITTGTFSSGFIADNAIITSKLLNGAVTSAKASNLDASNVTTGSFGTGQIPSLSTSKITSGTFSSGFIADNAIITSKLFNGAVTSAKASNLDASNVTSGSFGTGLIPTLPQSKVNGLPADITVASTLTDHARDIASLKAAADVSINQGKTISIDFTKMADSSSLPTTGSQRWSTTYISSTTGATWGTSGGKAAWVGNISGSGAAKIIYTGDGTADSAKTLTDYQTLRGVLIDPPSYLIFGGIGPRFTAMARVSDDGNSYVWARAYFNGLTLLGEIGCTINGVEQTPWQQNIPLTWSTEMTLRCGTDTNVRTYQVYSGSVLVTEYTDNGSTTTRSRLCDLNHNTPADHTTSCTPYRRFGAIAAYSSNLWSGTVSSVAVYDSAPVTYAGSLARMSRVSTGTFNMAGATSALTSFFDTQDYESLDIDGTTTTSSFKVTKSKMYMIIGRIKLTTYIESVSGLAIQVSKDNGSTWTTTQYGNLTWPNDAGYYNGMPNGADGLSLNGTWLQYLNAGEIVRLATFCKGSGKTGALTGTAAPATGLGSAESYFIISGLM